MEFRHLRYFLVLSEELHFGKAARRLAISQPPLSVNIRQLEESVGAKLFDRNSKEVRLTAAGRAFVPAARVLLEQAADASRHAREVGQGMIGVLRIGFVGSMLFRGFPSMIQRFQAANPRLRLLLREMNSENQINELSQRQLDVGFVHTTRSETSFSRMLFSSEPFVCCLPQGHPFARSRKLAVRRLDGEPLIMFSRTASPDYFERVLSICTAAGVHPEVRHEARHWLSVVSMVAHGMGVALVPEALRRSAIPGAVFVPIDTQDVRSQAFCIWRDHDENAGLQAFLMEIRAVAESSG
jgi:DNA-binding transcriptional LysR family regulator